MPIIESIDVCAAAVPLEKVTSFSNRTVSTRHYGLVKVRSTDGVEGIGFCYVGSAGGAIFEAAVQSLLGEALTGERQYADAERTLLAAHQRLATLPLVPPHELRQTLARLVGLYEAWQSPERVEDAARWRAELNHLGGLSGPPPPRD